MSNLARERVSLRVDTIREGEFWERFWSTSLNVYPLGNCESEVVRNLDGIGVVDTILEIGIGEGRNLPALREKCRQLIGIDISSVALQRAKTKFPSKISMDLGVQSGYATGLADESCDVVVATDLMNHLSSPRLFCQEVLRVLKTEGQFLGNAMSIRDRSRSAMRSKGEVESSGEFRISWNSAADQVPVWLTMRYYEERELEQLFAEFVWVEPLAEYVRNDEGHPPPFDSQSHQHVFWKLHLRKP